MRSVLIPIFQLLAVAASIVWMLRNEKDKSRPILVLALIFNLFYGTIASIGLRREATIVRWKYDFILFHLDQALGIAGTSIAARLQGSLKTPLILIYEAMVPLMVVWLVITRRLRTHMQLVLAYAAELVLAPIIYSIVPACGPIYALGPKWLTVSSVPLGLIGLNFLPNAFPSLHTATAMVLVLFAPGRKSRAVAVVFLIGTLMATLATGEHYLIDLVAGLSFACLASSCGRLQWVRILAFLGIVLAWSLSCRLGYRVFLAEPMLLRAFALVTVCLAAWTIRSAWNEQTAGIDPAGKEAAPISSVQPLGAQS